MITQQDIADKCELDRTTVTKILAGEDHYRASVDSRVDVIEEALELGYDLSKTAKSIPLENDESYGKFKNSTDKVSKLVDRLTNKSQYEYAYYFAWRIGSKRKLNQIRSKLKKKYAPIIAKEEEMLKEYPEYGLDDLILRFGRLRRL